MDMDWNLKRLGQRFQVFTPFFCFYTHNWYCIFSFPEHSVGSGAAAEADCVPYTLHPRCVEGERSYQGGRIEGGKQQFYTGKLRPVLQPPPPPILGRNFTPFVYLLLTNGTSFTYLVKNTASF